MKETISDYGEAILYFVVGLSMTGLFTMILNTVTSR